MSKYKDPTRTLTIRKKAISGINRRFDNIKYAIKKTIVNNKILTNAVDPADPSRFVFLYEAEKVDEFSAWLHENIQLEILQRNTRFHWLSVFVRYGYERGVLKTRNIIMERYRDAGLIGTGNPMTIPEHVQRSELLFTRVYTQLKGVTEVMESQIASVLSDGIIKGHSVKIIAKDMMDRVDKIGKVRARLIARTEIVNAHNVATVGEAERLEALIDEPIKMVWITAMDGRERPAHRVRNKKIFTKERALSLLGEPNCRCSISPYLTK